MASKVKNFFSKIGERLSRLVFFRKLFPTRESSLLTFCLLFIIIITAAIRFLPYSWGYQLSEFDPYFHYDVTEYVVENGFSAWFNWHHSGAWYPQGRDIWKTSYPGLPFSSAIIYFFLTGIGLQTTVYNVCVAFPILMAVLTCIAMYYFGKELGNKKTGLLAALLLAINPAHIGRTSLGFFDTENVGIFGIILVFLFYLRSLDQEKKWGISLMYSILAGLSLGYVFASWGASRYPLSLLAIFTLVLLITKRYTQRLFISYSVVMGVSLAIAVGIPKLGLNFITEFEPIAAIGILLLLIIQEVSMHLKQNIRTIVILFLLLLIGSSTLLLWHLDIISLPVGKFMTIINPLQRTNPLVQSVQEHRPTTWSAFYYQFGLLVFLAPIGLYFVFQKLTTKKLFLVLYMITSLYFAASMIRLTIILAPAICILGSIALIEVLSPFVHIIIQKPITRRRRWPLKIGRGFSIFCIICLFLLTYLPLMRGVDSGYAPTTIASSSIPVRLYIGDWSEALAWLKENIPQNTVVASWWDYGYWIMVEGEKITLADNGTINSTQISRIGRMFMSNETEAISILEDYDVEYLTVFTTLSIAWQPNLLYGDEVKWRWMAKIGGLDDEALEDTSITSQIAEAWAQNTQDPGLLQWYQNFAQLEIPKTDIVLTKLMVYGSFGILQPDHFQLSFTSQNRLVFVYKVIYP